MFDMSVPESRESRPFPSQSLRGPVPRPWRLRLSLTLATAFAVLGLALSAPPPEARAQTPDPDSPPSSRPTTKGTSAAPREVGDLTTRYRFIERYATDEKKARPGDVLQYRVGVREMLKVVSEKSQGTPDRTETTVQVIYTERPASLSTSGVVTDTVRRYEAYQVTPLPPQSKPSSPKPLEGLTVWYRARPGGTPMVMTLTPDHPLTETEYSINLKTIFLPDLTAALPSLPSRVGDRWRIPRSAAQAILGDRPLQGDPLTATFEDIRKSPSGGNLVAVITIKGHALMPPAGIDTVVHAQIAFTFAPTAPGSSEKSGSVDARGAITNVRLARSSTAGIPAAGGGAGGRLRRTLTRELLLQRDLTTTGATLAVPSPAPVPRPDNSWITYHDPRGRFHFRHPQELHPTNDPLLEKDDMVQLGDNRAGGNEGRVLTLRLQPRTGKSQTDRNNRDPEFHLKELNEEWTRNRQDVLRGRSDWLPEADWASRKMRVHRIEAAVRPGGSQGKNIPRVFLDHYLVLFSQNESLVADAMTGQDPPIPFREQVEEILKTFQLDTPVKPSAG
ncbi:MAG: hypothetical protein NVSMB9_25740 [Isosphaeraceae bacterium]